MRNTDQYPITLDEMIDACERAAAKEMAGYRKRMVVGDITAMALTEAANRLKRLQFAAQDTAPTRKRYVNGMDERDDFPAEAMLNPRSG